MRTVEVELSKLTSLRQFHVHAPRASALVTAMIMIPESAPTICSSRHIGSKELNMWTEKIKNFRAKHAIQWLWMLSKSFDSFPFLPIEIIFKKNYQFKRKVFVVSFYKTNTAYYWLSNWCNRFERVTLLFSYLVSIFINVVKFSDDMPISFVF